MMSDLTRELRRLAERARAGDEEAFERLFATVADRAQRFVRLRLGQKLRGEVESLDVLQEAYGAAFEAMPQFHYEDDAAFSRWFLRIIENRIRELARKHEAQKRKAPGEMQGVSRVLDAMARGTGPVTQADRAARAEVLERAIDRLDAEEREVVLARFFEERPVTEIAERTQQSTRSVQRLLGRAIGKLGGDLREIAP